MGFEKDGPKKGAMDPKDRALLEEAMRETRKQSVFWSMDHPPDNMDRGRPFNVADAWTKRTQAECLDGARESLAGAERMLAAATRKREDIDETLGRIKHTFRADLQTWIYDALKAHARGDMQRAFAEVKHWREYVQHYSGKPPAPKAQPVAQDARLPREPGDDDDAGLPW